MNLYARPMDMNNSVGIAGGKVGTGQSGEKGEKLGQL